MWILRFLNGPLAGQIVPLTKHQTLLGRSPTCDIKVPSANISKEHTRIEVFDDKLIISDAGSRNGTFINGVQVRSSKAKAGDKIGVHDIFFEVQKVPDNWQAQQNYRHGHGHGHGPGQAQGQAQGAYGGPPPQYGNVAYQMPPPHAGHDIAPEPQGSAMSELLQGKFPQWALLFQEYLERVVLPGMYRLPQIFEFKWVLAGLMAVFIFMVTALSTVPLMRILKSSIEEDSQEHAMTIATVMAKINLSALQQGMSTAINTEIATNRPGVTNAYILSAVDGSIVAPASQAGSYPDMPYVHEGRKLDHQSVRQVDDNTVVAMVPVQFYNQETGQQAIINWSVVVFNMSSLVVDNRKILGLFISTLFIALLLGFVLFYFLYKIIEHPIRQMNVQLDQALKEGLETVHVDYMFPAIQLLASNVSSALARSLSGQEANAGGKNLEHDRNREIGNLVELIGFAAMGIRASDLTIAAVNQAFEARIGVNSAQLATLSLNELSDQALKLSIKDLIERVDKNPDDIASNDLEFSGLNFQIVAQAVFGSAKIAYYLVVLLPKAEAE